MSILRKVNAAAAVRTALERLLAPVDPAWEKSVVDAYVAAAHSDMKAWTEYLGKPEPKVWNQRRSMPDYILWTKPAKHVESYMPVTHELHQQRLKAGQYSADVKRATSDGKRQYQQIREAFLLRVGETIENVVQEQSVTIFGEIKFGRRIEGYVTSMTLPNTSFRLKVSVKTNYRYGHNAANGRLTVYSQYPVLFDAAQVSGAAVTERLSEALLANLISGLPIDHKERASREQINAKQARMAERRALEDKKQMYYDLAHLHDRVVDYELSLRPSAHEPLSADMRKRMQASLQEYRDEIAAKCAHAGVADPGSKAAARAMHKQLLAQIKQLKGKA